MRIDLVCQCSKHVNHRDIPNLNRSSPYCRNCTTKTNEEDKREEGARIMCNNWSRISLKLKRGKLKKLW